jgi:hypothetical protein
MTSKQARQLADNAKTKELTDTLSKIESIAKQGKYRLSTRIYHSTTLDTLKSLGYSFTYEILSRKITIEW